MGKPQRRTSGRIWDLLLWRQIGAGALLAAALGMLLSCKLPSAQQMTGLTVVIGASSASRTLVPNVDMNAASYLISGSGPSGASFSTTLSSGTSTTIPVLASGSWTVSASGKNAAGTLITYGSASTQVSTGSTSTVNITVTPIVGPGSLSLTVSWPTASVASPSIQAQLVPASGNPIPLTFSTPANGSASYSGSGIMNGYYTLTLQLFDGTALVMGAVDVVEIVQGQTTSGTYAFSAVNPADGKITVNITPNLLNPLAVAMNGQPASAVGSGTAVTLSASVPAGTGNVIYAWYVNGVSQAVASSFTLNSAASPLSVGTYRVDATAFTADGLRAGSVTATVNVQSVQTSYTTSFPLSETPISENGNWINGGTVGLDWNNALTTPGLAQGQGPSSVAYSDPTAILAGAWGPNQTAQATVHSVNQTSSYYQEVELRLRTVIAPHSITGYEINFRCLKTSSAYMQIVRWNGALGSFTILNSYSGAQYGVANGDFVKASISGNQISVYINGVLMGSATDSTFPSGNPGIGFDYGCGTTYGDFGLTSFAASSP